MATNANHSVLTNAASPVDRVNKLNTHPDAEEQEKIPVLA